MNQTPKKGQKPVPKTAARPQTAPQKRQPIHKQTPQKTKIEEEKKVEKPKKKQRVKQYSPVSKMDLGDYLFGVSERLSWRAKNLFVVKQMAQLDYIMPERENFRQVDLTKDSTGKRIFSSYPNGGILAIQQLMRPHLQGGGQIKSDAERALDQSKEGQELILQNGLAQRILPLSKKCWGVIGLDHDDGVDNKYERYSYEFELNPYGLEGTNKNVNGEIDSEGSDNYSKFGGFGNLDSYKGIYRKVPGPSRKAMQFDICGEEGVRGNIDPLDPLNPYGIHSIQNLDEDDKAEYQEMLADQTRFETNQSGAGGLRGGDMDQTVNMTMIEGNNSFDASFLGLNNTHLLQIAGPLGGIFMKKVDPEILHLEIPANLESAKFEVALALVASYCEDIDLTDVDSLKFHANTWGLSAVKHFAETFVPMMKELTYIDMSDTLGFRPRSDLPMSLASILFEARFYKIIELNLNDNFLDKLGASAFKEFLEFNPSIKKLKVRGCGLGLASVEMMQLSAGKNPKLQLTDLEFGKNDLCDEGMKLMGLYIQSQKSLENLDVSYSIKQHRDDQKPDGLKFLFECLYDIRHQIRMLNVSGNMGINAPGTMDSMKKYLSSNLYLREFKMSNMKFDHPTALDMTQYLVNDLFGSNWNLNNIITVFHWDGDLAIDKDLATKFMKDQIPGVYNIKLKVFSMQDVFVKDKDKDEQEPIEEACQKVGIRALVRPPPKVGGYMPKKKKAQTEQKDKNASMISADSSKNRNSVK